MKILNYTATAVLIFLIFYLLFIGKDLLLPLVIAIALWYLINVLARAFSHIAIGGFRFPMPVCLTASFLTFIFLILALINFLSSTVGDVLDVAPIYQENLTTRLENLSFVDMSEFEGQSLPQLLTTWLDIPSFLTSIASSLTSILASGGLILIYIGFLFLEQGHFTNKITALVADPNKEQDANKIINRIRDDIQKYITIKIITSSLTGMLSYIILRIADVDFAGVWGLLIFLLNFIPTIGSIIATIFPALIALAQSDGYTLFLVVLFGIGALQVCIGNILEPRLMGSSFNLSPIIILLNLALWGYIWGIPGMFLCVPFLIIVTIILSHFPQTRPMAIILSSDGRLRVPIEKTVGAFSSNPSVFTSPSNDQGKTGQGD
ncbi:MAG: AI-2E family transporter [Pseudomonadota bacterium]|nr:AI-2E family transporter [Pseudomonadota bacterium]|tara:strand:- start:78 stop:1208 length:1131 start_codon:yes stop_codon:yes gene_type:complete